MSKYDFMVIGRWRNHVAIREVVAALRDSGKRVYCFVESEYDANGVKFENNPNADGEAMMANVESLTDWYTNPTYQKVFETDMQAERDSDALVLVFPAGLSAHMELGAAYGMGKKCYAVGAPEKPETLYKMLDTIFPDVASMTEALV